MPVNKKIETVNNKIKQNKSQYDFYRHTAQVSGLSSGNVGKYEFLMSEDV